MAWCMERSAGDAPGKPPLLEARKMAARAHRELRAGSGQREPGRTVPRLLLICPLVLRVVTLTPGISVTCLYVTML